MERIRLGRTGLKVSRVGLGTLAFGHRTKGIQDRKVIHGCINRALDGGINLIDTAEEYSGGLAETHVGEVVRKRGGREDVVIVTKVSHDHLDYKNVLKAASNSLRRLQTGYIDIYLLHWPWCYSPISETMKAMDELLADGKVRHVGLSNFPNALVKEARAELRNGDIVVNELEYSLVARSIEKEILPYLRRLKMPVLAHSPLSSGFLTAKYDERSVLPESDFRNNYELFKNRDNFIRSRALFEAMRQIAEAHGASPAEVAINWLLCQKGIIPIPGAKKAEHVDAIIHAAEWSMSRAEASRLAELTDRLELDLSRF